jgi:hypothetical protein
MMTMMMMMMMMMTMTMMMMAMAQQLLVLLGAVYPVRLPPAYESLLSSFSVLNFDPYIFFKLGCV